MTANPFDAPASSYTPGRSLTKVRIVWFLFGFVCSWISWSTVGYIRMRPSDMTQGWPEEMREVAPDWMKETKGVVVGQFAIVTPVDSSSARAIVFPVEMPSTGAIFEDDDSDGRVDSIMLADVKQRTWSIRLGTTNGEADSFKFSSGFARDSVMYEDGNADGQYDTRYGLGEVDRDKRVAVWIDSKWHESTVRGVKRYVEIDGTQVEVNVVDGVWQRVSTD